MCVLTCLFSPITTQNGGRPDSESLISLFVVRGTGIVENLASTRKFRGLMDSCEPINA